MGCSSLVLPPWVFTVITSALAAYQYLSVAQQSRPQAVRHSIGPNQGSDADPGSAAAPLKDLQRALNDAKFPPGSLIYLRTGVYGDITIKDYPNAAFIHVRSEPGHTAMLDSLHIKSTTKWLFEGLQISRMSYYLVRIHQEASNIVLSGNELFSTRKPSGWSARDWHDKASTAILMETRHGRQQHHQKRISWNRDGCR